MDYASKQRLWDEIDAKSNREGSAIKRSFRSPRGKTSKEVRPDPKPIQR